MSIDRLGRALTAIARHALSRVDYFGLYPARVIAQTPDGFLDLQPDDERLPGVTGVPIRLGLPGVKVKVSPGARVLLGFEGGDPSRPIATLWESHGIEEISFADGDKSVAREGDPVSLGYLQGMAGTIPVTFVLTPDPTAIDPENPPEMSPIVDLSGSIVSGASKVKA